MRISGIRAFIVFAIGQTISVFGTNVSGFALSVWVFERTQSVTQYALLVSFMTLPGIFVKPVAGALVDRWDRRAVLLGSDVLAALLTVTTLILVWTNTLSVWYVYLMTFVQTVTSAFQVPAGAAAMQLLVPPAQLNRANAAIGASKSLSSLVSPLATGALLAMIGLEGVLYIDLATFAVAVTTLAIIRIPPVRSHAVAATTSLFQEMKAGWEYIAGRRGLVLLAVVSLLISMIFDMARVLLPPLVLSFSTAEVLGAILSSAGLGILLGNLLMLPWGGPRRKMYGILGFGAAIGVGLILSGLRPSALLIGIGAAIVMTSISIVWICLDAIWLTKVPPNLIGRVKGTTTTLDSILGTATLLSAGLLADRVFEPLLAEGGALSATVGPIIGSGAGRGIALLLILNGLVALLLVGVAAFNRHTRLLEDTLPDVDIQQYTATDEALAAGV
ncbi:MAG TPA: MFS transporter [Herpetosiphonaceae bacterium]